MSPSLQALRVIEEVRLRSRTLAEIAAATGTDPSATVADLVGAGWLLRDGDDVRLGPRMLLLGSHPGHVAFLTRARELVHLLSGLSGLMVVVSVLAGNDQVLVAAATGPDGTPDFVDNPSIPLPATASGVVLLAQLDDAAGATLLDTWDLAPLTATTPDRAALDRAVARCRSHGHALDEGWSDPAARCVAVPYPGLDGSPAAIAAIGFAGMHAERLAFAEAQLRAAGAPGATRASIIRSVGGRADPDGSTSLTLLDAVRAALRDLHQPAALADNLLAPTSGSVRSRAAVVRERLQAAVDQAFGADAEDTLLRAVIDNGYLAVDAGPARAMRTLHISRTTYFRRAAEATERIAAQLLESA